MDKDTREGLVTAGLILGIYGAILAYSPIDLALNARSERVETPRGTALVVNWNKDDRRGIQIYTGGIPSCTTYSDKNRDGILDDITHMFGAPRRGVFTVHPKITPEEQMFFERALSETSTNTFPARTKI